MNFYKSLPVAAVPYAYPLSHSSAINHKDLVGVLNRGQTMGNRNNSFTVC